MKNLFLTIGLLAACLTLSAADLKQSVCVVSHDDQATDSLYQQLGTWFQNSGYINVGRSMRNRSRAFGSGFVYQAPSGNKYIVTNRHVVYPCGKVKLEFSPAEGKREFAGCKVLYTNKQHDIALVALPEGADMPAIKAASVTVSDGQEVYSAGFPGLGGNPIWQLGKGVISNTRVNTGDLGDSDSLLLYQHTAQVDHGNSGGPLLVKKGEEYQVIGINTYKASTRENTNFSVFLSDLNDAVAQLESNKLLPNDRKLEATAGDFIKSLRKGYTEAADYISTDMLLQLSEKKAKALFGLTDSFTDKIIREVSPELGLKMLIAKEFINAYPDSTQLSLNSASEDGTTGSTQLQYKKKVNSLTWSLTDEGWQISSTDALAKDAAKGNNSGSYKEYGVYDTDWVFGMDVCVRMPINDNGSYGLSLSLADIYFLNYGTWDLRLECYDFGHKVHDIYWDEYKHKGFAGGASTNLGVQVPIKVKYISLIPFVKAGPALCGSADDFALLICSYAGLKVGYEFNKKTTLFLDAHYTYRYKAAGDVSNDFNPHTVEVGIGFAL